MLGNGSEVLHTRIHDREPSQNKAAAEELPRHVVDERYPELGECGVDRKNPPLNPTSSMGVTGGQHLPGKERLCRARGDLEKRCSVSESDVARDGQRLVYSGGQIRTQIVLYRFDAASGERV